MAFAWNVLIGQRALLVVSALSVSLWPHLSVGWSVQGHQIVAIIAETRLNDSTWKQLDESLGKDSEGGQANISDAEVCGWADNIRRERRDTATFHYVNVSHDSKGF